MKDKFAHWQDCHINDELGFTRYQILSGESGHESYLLYLVKEAKHRGIYHAEFAIECENAKPTQDNIKINDYDVQWNDFWGEWQVSHKEIGANLFRTTKKQDAIDFAKYG